MRGYYASKPEYRAKVLVYKEKWRKANQDFSQLCTSLRMHGLTLDQYHARYESQDFGCAICGEAGGKLMIDHHHDSGKRRGLLCRNCNTAIGMLRESPVLFARAHAYIDKWSEA
jgi:hypothetical protein